jgi:hypothetical protein
MKDGQLKMPQYPPKARRNNTLINGDVMVRAKDNAGRESPTWIKVYVDSTSPTGELWHFVVTDKDGNFQTQYSASSMATRAKPSWMRPRTTRRTAPRT